MSRMGNTVTVDFSEEMEKLSREQRKLRDKADTLVAKITTENRDFTKEEQAEYDEHVNGAVSYGQRVDRIKKLLDARSEDRGQPRTRQDVLPEGEDDTEKRAKADGLKRRSAYQKWLRHGMAGLANEERDIMTSSAASLPTDTPEMRALSSVIGSAGGFTCPPELQAQIETAMKDYSGIEQIGATVLPTSTGNDLPMPTVNDTSNEGEQVEENTAQTDSNVTFGLTTVKGFTFSSKLILIPNQLLWDSVVNIEALISSIAGERLGRITNRRFTTGNGANQPQGVVAASVLGKTAAGAAAIAYEELIDLEHSIDAAYRMNAGYMMHDKTVAALKKLKDSDGRPIWQPAAQSGMAAGFGDRINGYRYVSNNYMAEMGSGNRSIVFGNMRKYFIRTIGGIMLVRLTERYAERMQTGFFAFARRDGRLLDAGTNPVKHLVHP